MRRGLLIIIGIIVLLYPLTNAFSKEVQRGQTNVVLPSALLTVRVDNTGQITGTGSQIKVSHSEPGQWCHKVKEIGAILKSEKYSGYLYVTPKKALNLCNFNERDAVINIGFPAVTLASDFERVKNVWRNNCQESGKNGARLIVDHPHFSALQRGLL